MTPKEARARLASMNPSGQLLTPDQVATAAVRVVSDSGGRMNGEAVVL